ncbi:uncharacterized protein BDZ99DRAFT_157009 [Mytilinidion resinicola]|uniref:Uncharacterized protein n=1 Tax=Mytilinidion resinicola TaxID=574789 RepID=A0A6A6Y625_9PEZI|nr:uncharacterized protein BDZ99DRAFT_157009 [Mytilinidion resinicola]KAF2803983.1 hypothetical protein BDZ99DRAFT_157009 [Mytilinidion resinicola]
MPVAIFDTFMLFRRRAPMGGRRSEFPSYSWLGWKHGVQIPNFIDKTNLKEWKISCTWIVWYKRTSGAPDLVWDTTKSTVLLQEIGSKTGYRGRTSRDPTGELSMLGDHLKESFPQGFKDGVEKRKRCHFSVSEFASINPASQTPPSLNSLLSSKRPYDLLQFWTISTYYKIHLAFNQYKDCDEYFPLFDKDQEFCGIVRLDEEPPGNEAVHAEFLILSKACHDISKDVIWSTPVMERLSLLSQEMKESPLCNANRERYSAEEEIFHDDLYCVLCIQWKDDGVAERVGSGFIYRTAVEHAHFPGPVWKEIILG